MQKCIKGILCGLLITQLIGCKHEAVNTQTPAVSFNKDVLIIFQSNCAITNCHTGNGSGTRREDLFSLSDYNAIMKGGVTPYNSPNSRVYNVLSDVWNNLMPPNNPLPESQRILIRLWIDQGALNN